MISLSRLIKSSWPVPEKKEKKIISIKSFKVDKPEPEEPINHANFLAEKEEIIRQAQREAEAIVAEAKAYLDLIKEQLQQEKLNWEQESVILSNQAQQSGYEAGLQEGRAQGYNEASGLIEEAIQVVNVSKEDYRKRIESSEQTILELGLKVAERILGDHLEEKPEYFLSVVKRALKEAREYREIQLHIHPSYYEFLLSQKEDLLHVFPKETELYIYPDADLTEHSCIIESANGRIDATVDAQLKEVKEKLFEMLESE